MIPSKIKSLPLVVGQTGDLKKAAECPIMRAVRSNHFAYELRLLGWALALAVVVAVAIKYL